MTARKRNPRRVLLADLRILKEHLAIIISRWTVSGDVYVACSPGENPATHRYLQPRQPGQYPETQPEAWRRTAYELHQLADAADRLATYADTMAVVAPWPVKK